MRWFRLFFSFFLICILISFSSCKKEPDLSQLLIGPWKYSVGSVHSVITFRLNGSWQSLTKIEGRMLRIIESKKEIIGDWKILEKEVPLDPQPKDSKEKVLVKKNFLTMTPHSTDLDSGWENNVAVNFEIIRLTAEELVIKKESGRVMNLERLRSKKGDKAEAKDVNISVHSEPICVNVKKNRALSKSRYVCIDLNFVLSGDKDIEYIDSVEIPVEDKVEIKYVLHPRIRDIIILFFADKTYKEVKTLDKVKGIIEDLKLVLQPYFSGKLQEIEVNKVVVTASTDSVDNFMNMYIIQEAAAQEAKAGKQ